MINVDTIIMTIIKRITTIFTIVAKVNMIIMIKAIFQNSKISTIIMITKSQRHHR